MPKIKTPEYIKFELGEDYIYYEKDPIGFLDSYPNLEKIKIEADTRDYTDLIMKEANEYMIITNYTYTVVPEGAELIFFDIEDSDEFEPGDYVFVHYNGENYLYKLPEMTEWRDIFMSYVSVTVSGDKLEPIIIENIGYDYYLFKILDEKFNEVEIERDKIPEIIKKLRECSVIEVQDAYVA